MSQGLIGNCLIIVPSDTGNRRREYEIIFLIFIEYWGERLTDTTTFITIENGPIPSDEILIYPILFGSVFEVYG